MKVYCDNCKHFSEVVFYSCMGGTRWKKGDWHRPRRKKPENPKRLNKHNDCKLYEEKP